jgi:hypothetical protein
MEEVSAEIFPDPESNQLGFVAPESTALDHSSLSMLEEDL